MKPVYLSPSVSHPQIHLTFHTCSSHTGPHNTGFSADLPPVTRVPPPTVTAPCSSLHLHLVSQGQYKTLYRTLWLPGDIYGCEWVSGWVGEWGWNRGREGWVSEGCVEGWKGKEVGRWKKVKKRERREGMVFKREREKESVSRYTDYNTKKASHHPSTTSTTTSTSFSPSLCFKKGKQSAAHIKIKLVSNVTTSAWPPSAFIIEWSITIQTMQI